MLIRSLILCAIECRREHSEHGRLHVSLALSRSHSRILFIWIGFVSDDDGYALHVTGHLGTSSSAINTQDEKRRSGRGGGREKRGASTKCAPPVMTLINSNAMRANKLALWQTQSSARARLAQPERPAVVPRSERKLLIHIIELVFDSSGNYRGTGDAYRSAVSAICRALRYTECHHSFCRSNVRLFKTR